MDEQMRQCENCDRRIGRLEKDYPWKGHVVCGECYGRLSAEQGGDGASLGLSPGEEPAAADSAEESILWKGTPSLKGKLDSFVLCGIGAVVLLVLFGMLWGYSKDYRVAS